MSYVERRRFLWILFLIALTLLAIAANATTLARMRFEELAQQATAVARLRCLTTKSFWQNGEIWTDTQFQVVEQAKGPLPETPIVRTLGGTLGNLHSRVEEAPVFHPGEEAFLFLGGAKVNRCAFSAGRKAYSESLVTQGPARKPSRKTRPQPHFLIRSLADLCTRGFAICQLLSFK